MARTVNPETHARRRSEILAAAAVEFAACGVDGTSTARICKRAGIGSGTLFHYFGTKDEIFRAIFANDLPHVVELCAQATAESDPDRGLDLLIDHLVAELTSPLAPGLASAAYLQGNRDPEFGQIVATIDGVLGEAFDTLLGRIEGMPDRTLQFGAASTTRWVRGIVDAAHLGLTGESPVEATHQLRHIIDWLLGRRS